MKRLRCPSLRLALLLSSVSLAAACGPQVIANPLPEDLDGDGYSVDEGDCDDENPAIHPDAGEDCRDGIDNNCDEIIDEDDEICTLDGDGDGYVAAKDCNDEDPAVNPGAEEVCDGQDTDCNGVIDDVLTDELCASDLDEDGDGWLASEDCDDLNADVNPDAVENCDDLVDNDCDGELDWEDAECELILNG